MTERMIIYNGKDLGDFGVIVDFSQVFRKPAFQVSKWIIPGMNGDIIRPEDRYENIELRFDCLIRSNFKENFNGLIDYLTSFSGGYQRLETTAEPDTYRQAAFHSAIEPTAGQYLRSGRFTLVFDCMPQRWLKSGERPIHMAEAFVGHAINPTLKPARPLIRVNYMPSFAQQDGGVIDIGNSQISIAYTTYEFFIDCELMRAYRISGNSVISMDEYVSMPDNFVEIGPGDTVIGSTNADCDLYPRWWRL